MRRLMATAFIVVIAVIAAAPADAQDRPAGVNFGGGWTFPVTGLNDTFDTGWNLAIGGTYNITPTVGFLAEYQYHRMGGPDRVIDISEGPGFPVTSTGLIESNHQIHSGTFNLVYKTPQMDRPVGGYVLGGGGIYHRLVQLTTPSVGYTTICDPYWYVCYPTLVSVDTIIGDRSSNDFGINIGGGVTFGTDAKFYVEMRYHYVWGPEVEAQTVGSTTVCPNECSTNAQYFPLTLGFRW
jgi:opacity protein-like surface antigen